MEMVVSPISENEMEQFQSILMEAALWLKSSGKEMWSVGQLSIEKLLKHNRMEEMFIGYVNNEAAAAMIVQEKDVVFWPDANNSDFLFLHKLAVRRKYAGKGCAKEMVDWAKSRARSLHKRALRLDCAADRPELCEFYERSGFQKVNEIVLFNKYPTAFYEFEIQIDSTDDKS